MTNNESRDPGDWSETRGERHETEVSAATFYYYFLNHKPNMACFTLTEFSQIEQTYGNLVLFEHRGGLRKKGRVKNKYMKR